LIPDADDDGARNKTRVRSGGADHRQGDSKAGRTQKNITNHHQIMDYSIKAIKIDTLLHQAFLFVSAQLAAKLDLNK
jgi:hypothetical protein